MLPLFMDLKVLVAERDMFVPFDNRSDRRTIRLSGACGWWKKITDRYQQQDYNKSKRRINKIRILVCR
jgi:hypothetical protein